MKELKEVISELGHFPSREELDTDNRYDLKYGIYQNGELINSEPVRLLIYSKTKVTGQKKMF